MSSLASQRILAFGVLIFGLPMAVHATDSFSFEIATGNRTKIARIGMQSDWERQWWRGDRMHVTGYWEFSLAHWRHSRYRNMPGNKQNIVDIGVTPMLLFQSNEKSGLYAEVGIGIHYLTDNYDNNGRGLSNHIQYGSQLGLGYGWSKEWLLGIRVQHFSNGGVSQPNNGVNFAGLQLRTRF